ncbi:MAG: ABC transporter ATP-binding protein, partial [Oscillospiraceae bacterium]|nr:ABC transporter ATP-binding protein [Oscillospiraceae bacterium]
LFGCLLGYLRPRTGQVLLGGRDVQTLSGAEIAREIAYIPQSAPVTYNYTVLDTVLMGVTHQIGIFSAPKREHKEKAMAALESLGIAHLAMRGAQKISGGERQLALLARALVQEAGVLLMDEPTANLDYGNSFRVMQRIMNLGGAGYTVIFSTHEPNQAFRYANRVLALSGGGVLADGRPEEVLTGELLSELYGVGVAVRGVQLGRTELRLSVPYDKEEQP